MFLLWTIDLISGLVRAFLDFSWVVVRHVPLLSEEGSDGLLL